MRRWVLIGMAAAVVAVVAIAASGIGDDRGSADPADLTPADAAVYLEAPLEPSAEQAQGIDEAFEQFPPSLRPLITRSLQQSAEAVPGGAFAEGVPDWVGESVGGFVLGVDEGGGAALLTPVRELEPAQEFIDSVFLTEFFEDRGAYRGIDWVGSDDLGVAAIVDSVLVWATDPQALARSIDARLGADEALAGSERFDALEGLDGDPLVSLLVDESALSSASRFGGVGQLVGASAPPERGVLASARPARQSPRLTQVADSRAAAPSPYAAGVYVDGESLRFELLWTDGPEPVHDTVLLSSLPADSLLAAAAVNFGPDVAAGLRASLAEESEVDPRILRSQVAASIGFDPVTAGNALGEAAAYVAPGRGDLYTAGLVADVENQETIAAAIGGVRRVLREQGEGVTVGPLLVPAPKNTLGYSVYLEDTQPIDVALTGPRHAPRLVVMIGGSSIYEALDPPDELAGSARLDRARGLLGPEAEANFILETRMLRQLVALGSQSRDTRLARWYLRSLGTIAGGETAEGFRLVAELR